MKVTTHKDFGLIQDDYAFFEHHATEAAEDIVAYMPHVKALTAANRPVHMLDFGCGDGGFSAKFHASAQFAADRLQISLVEPVADYRQTAVERLQPLTNQLIHGWPAFPSHLEANFDLILVNHVLYYVPDLDDTSVTLTRALAPGGVFLTAMAGRGNVLMQFAERCLVVIGKSMPYHTAEGLKLVLDRQQISYSVKDVWYELRFPDSVENRLSILRFLLGEHFPEVPRQFMLDLFNPYVVDGQIAVQTMHEHFVIEGQETAEQGRASPHMDL